MKCILAAGESIDITLDGHTVRITAAADGDGNPYMHLGGIDCNLAGEQPGAYYLEPLESGVLQGEVDAEMERLAKLDISEPIGGWRNRAVEAVSARHAMNPYALDRLLRGVPA